MTIQYSSYQRRDAVTAAPIRSVTVTITDMLKPSTYMRLASLEGGQLSLGTMRRGEVMRRFDHM